MTFHAEERRIHLCGDGGIPGGAIEQAALTVITLAVAVT